MTHNPIRGMKEIEMSEQKLKDVTIMQLNEDRIARIREKFSEGESTKQEAFSLLVDNNIADLRPYLEAKDNGNLRLVRGANGRQKKLLADPSTGLNQKDLASTYIQPSVELAQASLEETGSEAYNYVIENLTELMDPNKGDIGCAPLFTPNRLMAAGKELKKKEGDLKFEVDPDDGLLLCGKRFGSYTIEEIKLAIRTGSSSPDAYQFCLDFFGMDPEETQNGKEKKGTIGTFITKVRENFSGVEGGEFALEMAEAVEQFRDEMRDALVEQRDEMAEATKKDKERKKLQRRLARDEAPVVTQEVMGGEAVTRDPEPEEAETTEA